MKLKSLTIGLIVLFLFAGCREIIDSGDNNNQNNETDKYTATFQITVKSNQNLLPIEGTIVEISLYTESGEKDTTLIQETDSLGMVKDSTELIKQNDPHTAYIFANAIGFKEGSFSIDVTAENPNIQKIMYLAPEK